LTHSYLYTLGTIIVVEISGSHNTPLFDKIGSFLDMLLSGLSYQE
jgi:hypothetical protein